ncbi:MAG: VWA domain-containing protein [Actinobacteria bacterium]|nr:VWA domain-containing protein [Actinomycetota bacterium]
MTSATHRPPEEILLGFARALRAAGLDVTADRERAFLVAASTVGLEDAAAVRWAGRATLCASPEDLARFDLVYAAWFGGEVGVRHGKDAPPQVVARAAFDDAGAGHGDGDDDDDDDALVAQASTTEVLRHRDVANLSPSEKARLARMFGRLRPRAPRRPARRHTASRRGEVDARRTLRATLQRLGEPGPVQWRRRTERPRRIVLLIDVSGSMSGYADSLLRVAHRYVRSGLPVEVFTLGTRLTHVTRALTARDADRAIVAAGEAIPDWSGGTRLAEGLAVFLRRWGRRGMARGAVVVVISDGWERGDPATLGEQMAQLRAIAHHVVWANPHRGSAAYEPVQAGILAALPHVDSFVAGHSMAAFEELTEVIARA